MSFQQAREVASQQVMAVERADASHEVGGSDHREDAVARFARTGTAELDETGRQQFLEHVGNKQVGLDAGPVAVLSLCPVQSLDVLQVGQACPRRKRLPPGVPPGHVLEAVCLLVESGFLPGPWLVPKAVSSHLGCGARTQFVSTIAAVARFHESAVPAILEDSPGCRRRIPAGRPATIDRPVLSLGGEEDDEKSPQYRTMRFSCVHDPRYPDR